MTSITEFSKSLLRCYAREATEKRKKKEDRSSSVSLDWRISGTDCPSNAFQADSMIELRKAGNCTAAIPCIQEI